LDIITPAKVFKEMQKLAWPEAELVIQPPDGRTLVNLETNFLTTTTEPTTQTVQLLGHGVEIEATPVSYRGTSVTARAKKARTRSRVPRPADHPRLRQGRRDGEPERGRDVPGRYRVDGGDWVQIPDTLTVAGTPVDLEVLSATPHLVG
jgi:hypothetical protein